MCIVCELKKARKGNDVVVGTVSAELHAEFKAYKVAEGLSDLDLDLEQKVLDARRAFLLNEIDEAEVDRRQNEIDAEIATNAAKNQEVHDALWERIYKELGIVGEERERTYTFNSQTGEVTTKKQSLLVKPGGLVH